MRLGKPGAAMNALKVKRNFGQEQRQFSGNEQRGNKRSCSNFKICDKNETFGILLRLEQKFKISLFCANNDGRNFQIDAAR